MVKALVFLAKGFEEIEASTIVDILRRCNVEVTLAGLKPDAVEGAHGIKFMPNKSIDEVAMKDFDAVICPGGVPGYENLRKDSRVLSMIKEAFEANKLTAAICASPAVLSDAGVLKGKTCTIYPGMEEELRKGGGKPREKGPCCRRWKHHNEQRPGYSPPFRTQTSREAGWERSSPEG